MAIEDAAGVGVNDEDRMISGIEKNGVRGLRALRRSGSAVFREATCGFGEESIQRAAVFRVEEGDEGLEPSSPSGGNNRRSESGVRVSRDALAGFRRCSAIPLPGVARVQLHVGPCGVLGQVGANDDFETGFGGPPMLRLPTLDKESGSIGGLSFSFFCFPDRGTLRILSLPSLIDPQLRRVFAPPSLLCDLPKCMYRGGLTARS